MASCEKCWRDAAMRAGPFGNQVAEYEALLRERSEKPCAPEEQAGPGATLCEDCQRKTRHQFVKVCMKCGRPA